MTHTDLQSKMMLAAIDAAHDASRPRLCESCMNPLLAHQQYFCSVKCENLAHESLHQDLQRQFQQAQESNGQLNPMKGGHYYPGLEH